MNFTKSPTALVCSFSLAACAGSAATALETPENAPLVNVGAHITVQSAPGSEEAVRGLLSGAGKAVADGEPMTVEWYALDAEDGSFAIFNLFAAPEGRQAHFAGDVAAALEAASGEHVEGGWEDGVLANVTRTQVLSAMPPRSGSTAAEATHITFDAQPGKADALAELLASAAAVVQETEPETLSWTALRVEDSDTFVIFDTFADNAGREAHFAGHVAALLKDKAEAHVVDGWDGVVRGIRNYRVLSTNL